MPFMMFDYTPPSSDGGNVFVGTHVGNRTLSPDGGVSHLASDNCGFGRDAIYSLTTGYANIAIGLGSLQFTTTGANNIAVGRATLAKNTTGQNNTAVGTSAMFENLTGIHNTALGLQAHYSNTSGSHNTSIGRDAGFSNSTGSWNTNVGVDAGPGCSTGSGNTCVGGESGYGVGPLEVQAANQNLTGSNNTWIGYQASNTGNHQDLNNVTALGYRAQTDKDNQVVIGNPDVVETVLRGTVIIDGTPITGAQVAALLALLTPSA